MIRIAKYIAIRNRDSAFRNIMTGVIPIVLVERHFYHLLSFLDLWKQLNANQANN
jgi:Ni,Fe-hydrogenase I large subunit